MSFAVVYPTEMPPAMILCGGQGTRIRDVAETLPKPMVPVGSQPIMWHIMKTYAAFGVRRFILCLGYRREAFIDYFLNYRARAMDITVHLRQQDNVVFHGGHEEENWEVTLTDTGDHTMTGGRVARAAKYLRDSDEHCFLTYGDGLANVDISQLLAYHVRARQGGYHYGGASQQPVRRNSARRRTGNFVLRKAAHGCGIDQRRLHGRAPPFH